MTLPRSFGANLLSGAPPQQVLSKNANAKTGGTSSFTAMVHYIYVVKPTNISCLIYTLEKQ